MDRAFTTREKILMLVLAVVLLACAYYLLVFAPSQSAIESSKTQVSQLESELTINQAMALKTDSMRDELEEKRAAGMRAKKTLNYDSTPAIMKELNGILAGTKTYSLSFAGPEPSEDGATVRQSASVSFTAASYGAAKSVVKQLVNSKYTSMVTDFSIMAADNGGDANAAVTIVYYENA